MSLQIQDRLLEALLASVSVDAPVRRVLVGAHMTAVCSLRCGISATFVGAAPYASNPVREAGRLERRSARELAQYALSDSPLEASIGVAALNSLLPLPRASEQTNASGVLMEKGRGTHVALVGHFPFVPRLREAAAELWVIEQQPLADEYPASAAVDLLPKAEVVGITGSALVNHTLEGLLSLCSPSAYVVVLGPTTPFSKLLFDRGATLLCGAEVVDEDAALQSLAQGAHFRQFGGVKMIACDASGLR